MAGWFFMFEGYDTSLGCSTSFGLCKAIISQSLEVSSSVTPNFLQPLICYQNQCSLSWNISSPTQYWCKNSYLLRDFSLQTSSLSCSFYQAIKRLQFLLLLLRSGITLLSDQLSALILLSDACNHLSRVIHFAKWHGVGRKLTWWVGIFLLVAGLFQNACQFQFCTIRRFSEILHRRRKSVPASLL